MNFQNVFGLSNILLFNLPGSLVGKTSDSGSEVLGSSPGRATNFIAGLRSWYLAGLISHAAERSPVRIRYPLRK